MKLHLHQAYKKLGINTRVELVMRRGDRREMKSDVEGALAPPGRADGWGYGGHIGVLNYLMVSIRVMVVLAGVLVPAAAFAGSQPVRVPRDSALVVNGVIRPMTGGTPAVVPQPPAPVGGAGICTSRVVPDPGYRPMWVPGEWCADGGTSIWIPGHWVW